MRTNDLQYGAMLAVWGFSFCTSCGRVADSEGDTPKTTVSIYSWWVTPGEKDALDAVIAMHEASHPGIKIQNLTGTDADQAREQLTTRIENGNPPDSYQANIGKDLMKWVKSNGKDTSESPLTPVDQWIDKTLYDQKIADNIAADGKIWAVPVNIHRINSLFFNTAVFDSLPSVTRPSEGMDFNAFVTICDQLMEARPGTPVLALGNKSLWELEELVFEDVLPSIVGAEAYVDFWRGKLNPEFVRDAVKQALQLRKYVNSDYDRIDWAEALDKMVQSQVQDSVAMSAIGDWARGYFQNNHKWEHRPPIDAVQFPSAVGKVFIYTADALALPIWDSPTHDLAAQFLQTFTSIEAQQAFNLNKGSIPARMNVGLNIDFESDAGGVALSQSQLRTADAWAAPDTKYGLAMSGLIPNGMLTGLSAALLDSFRSGDAEPIMTYLTMNYSTLTLYGQ